MSAQLEDGYTRIANEILEKMACTYFSPYEWQVLMAIFRKTYGYHKKSDWIANSQLVTITGIHKAHVSRSLKKLLQRNVVTQTGNRLCFNKSFSSWLPKQVTIKKVTQIGNPVTHLGILELPKQADTKDTLTKDTIQKIGKISIHELNDNHFERIAKTYSVPISFVRSKYDDMVNWHESSGKQKKDWIATLRNFVKKDAVQIRKEQHDRSKIVFISE